MSAMSFEMGKKKDIEIQEPARPAPIPTTDDASVANIREKANREMRTRRGRASTFLSGSSLGDQGAMRARPTLS